MGGVQAPKRAVPPAAGAQGAAGLRGHVGFLHSAQLFALRRPVDSRCKQQTKEQRQLVQVASWLLCSDTCSHLTSPFFGVQVEKRERHQEYLRRKAAREAAQQAQEGQQEEAEAEVEAEAGSGESAGGAEGATDAAAEGAANGRPPEVRANGRGVSGRGGRGAERHGGRGRGGRGRGRGQLAGEAEATPQTEGGVEASVDAAA